MNFENLKSFSSSECLAKILFNRRKISLFLSYSLLKTAECVSDSRFPIEKEKMNKVCVLFERFSRCIVSDFQTAAFANAKPIVSNIKDTHLIGMSSRKIWLTRVVNVRFSWKMISAKGEADEVQQVRDLRQSQFVDHLSRHLDSQEPSGLYRK